MNVRVATEADAGDWDRFVDRAPHGTFYHQYGWRRAIERAYRLRTHYLVAEDADGVSGVLPLSEMRPISGAPVLVSLPFANYGGILARDDATARGLLDHACGLLERERLAYLELKQTTRVDDTRLTDKEHYHSLVLELSADPETVWKGSLNAKVRNQVRKARKSDLRSDLGAGYREAFLAVYRRNLRDLGTPVHATRWYGELFAQFENHMEVLVVLRADEVIAGALLLYFRDTAVLHAAASMKRYLTLCPNNLLYWECIERACRRGCARLDFARSRVGSGTYHFKQQWGAEPAPTYYQYVLNGAASVPDLDPHNPRYAWATRIWSRLPLPVANVLGPCLRKRVTT